jgi:hypothetical protein
VKYGLGFYIPEDDIAQSLTFLTSSICLFLGSYPGASVHFHVKSKRYVIAAYGETTPEVNDISVPSASI